MEVNGSTRWIVIPGVFQFQPEELAKFTTVLFLATWLSRERRKYKTIKQLLEYRLVEIVVFFFGLFLTGVLIVLSRDLGNAIVVVAISLIMFFVSGTDAIHTLSTFLAIILAGALGAVAAFVEPYRLERVRTYLDLLLRGEISDPRGPGYQISQILIGIGGSGGSEGTGFGCSRQRLGYLVEETAYTDSISAVVLEELGFYKGVIFVLIYGLFIYVSFRVALQTQDKFGQMLACGMAVWIVIQFCFHIGANLALVPLTGLTLPFISYGGSSIVMTMAAMAVILNVSRFARNSG